MQIARTNLQTSCNSALALHWQCILRRCGMHNAPAPPPRCRRSGSVLEAELEAGGDAIGFGSGHGGHPLCSSPMFRHISAWYPGSRQGGLGLLGKSSAKSPGRGNPCCITGGTTLDQIFRSVGKWTCSSRPQRRRQTVQTGTKETGSALGYAVEGQPDINGKISRSLRAQGRLTFLVGRSAASRGPGLCRWQSASMVPSGAFAHKRFQKYDGRG